METLFRLALVRPAVVQDPENPSIDLAQESSFQAALEQASQSERPREAMLRVARAYIASEDFIGHPDETELGAQLAKFAAAVDEIERDPQASHMKLVKAVEQAFDAPPKKVVQSQAFTTSLRDLRDSLLAIKQVQEEHSRPIEALTNQIRDLEIIQRTAQDEDFPDSPAGLRRYRRRSLKLPLALALKPVLSTAELEEKLKKERAEAEAEQRKRAEALFDRYRSLKQAIGELTGLGGEHFCATLQEPHEGFPVADLLEPTRMLSQQVEYLGKLSDLNLVQLKSAVERGSGGNGGNGGDPLHGQDKAGASSAADLARSILTGGPRLLAGGPQFRPTAQEEAGFRLRDSAIEALSERTRNVLLERDLSTSAQPLDRIVDRLEAEAETVGKEIDTFYTPPVRRSIKRIGDTLVTIATPYISAIPGVSLAGPLSFPLAEQIPHTRGSVAPAGIADLLVIKQQLTGYEGADVAHIENVLRGERKLREHTRRQETEEFSFLETETTTSEERELESTSRFEMTRETSTTIKEDASLKAGLNISGKYGPVVEFSASVEGSTSRSKEEATRAASSFSQEVTERSAIKITERVLERASLRVTNEVIEKNSHELNNVGSPNHISGIYQWVNKVYQAQMYNYGLRTMFDFMVPEPAAFIVEALNAAHDSATEIQKPPEFTLKPNEISEDVYSYGYYGKWVQIYGATDVTPPPEIYRTKSLDFHAGGGDPATNYHHSAQITIDDGYKAVHGTVGAVNMMWNNSCIVDVVLGKRFHRFVTISGAVFSTPLDEERDSIPFALVTLSVPHIGVAVEVKCQRTERAMEKWRYETHAKLTAAYHARLSEYEEKLAALQLQQGVAIRGRNPASNLEIMKDELKKNCISILTDQHYDLFDAIDISASNSLPQIDVDEAEAEGAYVRFFEQAFEWEQMTWVTYPYFWGRKNQWEERLTYEDVDPLFNQFLKAGFCRVSVPARPGFEGAIDHFMTYGELWNGGPLPPISSDLYLPIADEIAERLDQPGDEVPQGDPWMVRIPTTLVHLRADDRLPRWQPDETGEWVEV